MRILIIFLLLTGLVVAADPVILNLEWSPRGDWSSFRVEIKDSEGFIYTHDVGTAKGHSLTLESGEVYLIELSGIDVHTGDRIIISQIEWTSRLRSEGVFSIVH